MSCDIHTTFGIEIYWVIIIIAGTLSVEGVGEQSSNIFLKSKWELEPKKNLA